jgi:hypothetical protein
MDKRTFKRVHKVMLEMWQLSGWATATGYIDDLFAKKMLDENQYVELNNEVNKLGDWR